MSGKRRWRRERVLASVRSVLDVLRKGLRVGWSSNFDRVRQEREDIAVWREV